MDLYAQNIIDHYRNPRNNGTIARPTVSHREANYSCGDIIEVDMVIKKNALKAIKFRGEGCAISQAAISILSEHAMGKQLKYVLSLGAKNIKKILGVDFSKRREKCALLGLLTLQNAILKKKKNPSRQFSDLNGE